MSSSPFERLRASGRKKRLRQDRKARPVSRCDIEQLEHRIVPTGFSYTWTGAGATGAWNDPGNWSTVAGNDPYPNQSGNETSGITLTFGAVVSGSFQAMIDNLGSTLAIDSMTFNASGYSLAGTNSATILSFTGAASPGPSILDTAGGNSFNTTGGFKFNLASSDLQVEVDTGTDTIAAPINGAFGVNKTGSGTLVLSSTASAYTGITTITAGTLKLGASNTNTLTGVLGAVNNGASTCGTLILSGGTLDTNGFSLPSGLALGSMTGKDEAITLAGGTIINSQSTTSTFSGAITLSANSSILANAGIIILSSAVNTNGFNLTVGGSSTNLSTLSGVISGTGSLTKDGPGTWIPFVSTTFTGGTTINEGIFRLNQNTGGTTASAIGGVGGSLLINSGGMLDMNGFSIGVPLTATVNGTGIGGLGAITNGSTATAVTWPGNLSAGSDSIVAAAGGIITFSGSIGAKGGTLQFGSKAVLVNSPAVSTPYTGQAQTVSSGATLDLSGVPSLARTIAIAGTGEGGNGALVNNSPIPFTLDSTGSIVGVTLTSGGSGYSFPDPSVSISDPGGGTGATAKAFLGLTQASLSFTPGTSTYNAPPAPRFLGGEARDRSRPPRFSPSIRSPEPSTVSS